MRRSRLGALGASLALALAAVTAGTATAATPTATASQSLVAGSPSAVDCDGAVNATATVTTQGAASTGTATSVMLVLDLSGSVDAAKRADQMNAAKAVLAGLDAADGATDQSIAANAVGLEYYQGGSATVDAPVGTSYADLLTDLAALPADASGSPHDVGITTASAALSGASGAHAIVLLSDGQADGALLASTTLAASNFKTAGGTIVTLGIGTDDTPANLQAWASTPGAFQQASPGPVDGTKAAADLGALASSPTTFELDEALGSAWSATGTADTGTVTPGTGSLQWSGTLTGSQSATLQLHATRNGSQVFAATNETVATASLAVSGGTGSVTVPAAITIDVLPCGAAPIAATTCTGGPCSVSATDAGGTAYSASVGSPPAGTKVSLATLNAPAPPAGACPGFVSHTKGAELDVRPLATTAKMTLTIPKASLGHTPWLLTDICLGTNLRFVQAISSIKNLSPDAKLLGGGSVPGRWWGILPSFPRLDYLVGKGFVVGPWVTNRAVTKTGSAVISFTIPFVAGTAGLTTDGKVGYDPKLWG